MEYLCPECMGTLQIQNETTARCLTHGGEYQVLFSSWQPPVEVAPTAEFELPADAVCARHPNVPAAGACPHCGVAMCDTCAFVGGSGRKVCLQCFHLDRDVPAAPPVLTAPVIPVDARCIQHPGVLATQQCKLCASFMCPTCDFLLPGGLHLCPKCATAPRSDLSPRRKKFMYGSFALALFATLGMVLMLSGFFAGMVHQKSDYTLLGTVFMMISLIPAIIGMSLGFSAIDRRQVNPIILWVATVWNMLVVGIFLLLMIVGMFK